MRIPSKTKTKLTKGQRELDVVFLDNNCRQPLRFNQRSVGFILLTILPTMSCVSWRWILLPNL